MVAIFSRVVKAKEEKELEWLCKAAQRLWSEECREIGWPPKVAALLQGDLDEMVFPDWYTRKDKRGIEVYSNEGASIQCVVPVVQVYLQKFHPRACWSIQWSEYEENGSQFGGGAAFVTPFDVKWMSTAAWVDNVRAAWEENL